MARIHLWRVRNTFARRIDPLFRRLVSVLLFVVRRAELGSRKPLGEPNPQASNLALAVVLLIVIVVQTAFVSPHAAWDLPR